MAKLISIPFSHYNEKARWALDRFGVVYEEERWMPMLHGISTVHHIGTFDRVSTPLATPVFIADDGRVIHGSSRIARWASDNYAKPGEELYPDPAVARLEAQLSNRLGPATRRVAYFHVLQEPELVKRMADANVGETQATWFKRLYPLLGKMIGTALRVEEDTAKRSVAVARAIFDRVGRRVREHRYLIGERFTAADLTFASLASPLLLPSPEEGFGAKFPEPSECPDEFRAIVEELRDSEAGRYALRLFREERGTR